MALIWQNPNTDPAYYKCYALKHLQPRLQSWCPVHLFFPVSFFPAPQRKYFLGADTRGQNNKHKQGEAERCWIHFHGTYHCCRGESKANDVDTKGCMCLGGWAQRVFFFYIFCYFDICLAALPVAIQASCLHVYIQLSAFCLNVIRAFYCFLTP